MQFFRFINKVKWKYLFLLFLVGVLCILFFVNLLIRDIIDEALFFSFVFIIGLIVLIPMFVKIWLFIQGYLFQKKLQNDPDIYNSILESIALHHDISNPTPIDIIVENVVCIIRAFVGETKVSKLKIKRGFNIYYINGSKYNINDYIAKEHDVNIYNRYNEIIILYRKKISMKEIIKLSLKSLNDGNN